jgi:hypothetical protein
MVCWDMSAFRVHGVWRSRKRMSGTAPRATSWRADVVRVVRVVRLALPTSNRCRHSQRHESAATASRRSAARGPDVKW